MKESHKIEMTYVFFITNKEKNESPRELINTLFPIKNKLNWPNAMTAFNNCMAGIGQRRRPKTY